MERPNLELPIIIAQTGPLNGKRWGIDKDIHIGREQNCEIMIPDRQVSRYHARLRITDGGIVLEDLGSKNGTFLNGEQLEDQVILQDGDIFQIALVQNFYYLSSDATLPLDQQFPEKLVKNLPDNDHIRLDSRSRRVWINNEEVLPPLSVPQFVLLQTLYEQAGEVVPRNELVSSVWGSDKAVGVSEQALDALVRRLRERLAEIDPDHEFIITIRGHGIRLDN